MKLNSNNIKWELILTVKPSKNKQIRYHVKNTVKKRNSIRTYSTQRHPTNLGHERNFIKNRLAEEIFRVKDTRATKDRSILSKYAEGLVCFCSLLAMFQATELCALPSIPVVSSVQVEQVV